MNAMEVNENPFAFIDFEGTECEECGAEWA